MDEFAFDLDRALDELEEEEGSKDTGGATTLANQLSNWPETLPTLSAPKPSAPVDSSSTPCNTTARDAPPLGTVCNGSSQLYIHSTGNSNYEPPLNLDLSEADFGPSKSLLNPLYDPQAYSTEFTFDEVDGIQEEDQLIVSKEESGDISVGLISPYPTDIESSEKLGAKLGVDTKYKPQTRDSPDGRCVVEAPHLDPVEHRDASLPADVSPQATSDITGDNAHGVPAIACQSSNSLEQTAADSSHMNIRANETSTHPESRKANHISKSAEDQTECLDQQLAECPQEMNSHSHEHENGNGEVSSDKIHSQEDEETTISQMTEKNHISTPKIVEPAMESSVSTKSNTGASDNSDIHTNSLGVVGFSAEPMTDLELSNDEMEQYLSTIGGPDNYTEFDAKPSLAAELQSCAPVHRSPIYADGRDMATDILDMMTASSELPEDLEERRDSGSSLEKFLVPTVMSPAIATPIEDPGYSKVPGYVPDIKNTIVEEMEEEVDMDVVGAGKESVEAQSSEPTQTESSQVSASSAPENAVVPEPVLSSELGGARPKEQVRISRPNSLLGLSTPDLPSLTTPHSANEWKSIRDSGIVEGIRGPGSDSEQPRSLPADLNSVDDSESASSRSIHDKINMQLAAQKSAPQLKKQMNLAIQQQDSRSLGDTSRSTGDISPVSHLPRPTTLGADMPPSVFALGSQSPGPSQHPPGQPTLDNRFLPMDGTESLSVEGSSAGSSPGQKRPTSLSLAPPPVNQDDTSGENTPSPEYCQEVDDANLAIEAADAAMAATGQAVTMRRNDRNVGAVSANEQDSSTDHEIGAVGPVPAQGDGVPPSSSNINLAITLLGKVAPVWVPDGEAASCMECDTRFTFTKRRHHCRACGKVFCSSCCNLRSRIPHMDNKEARVCSKCYQDLIRAQVYEKMHQPGPRPNPNNPSEYCSTVPPMQQAARGLSAPPPTVLVPVGVLRKEGNQRRSEGPKQVMFSDGIRPGGDLTELDGADQRIPPQRSGRRQRRVDKSQGDDNSRSRVSRDQRKSVCLIPEQGLPPVLLSTGVKGDFCIEENPDAETIMPKMHSTDDPEPVVFAINKNLFVLVKIVNLDCCVNRVCWCFTTKGMCTVGQDEIVIVLECLPDEKTVPRDIFCHFHAVYEEASKGNTVSHLGHTIFAQGFLDSRDHSGFLYINATYQCLQKLILPPQPYIFGILLQKWETPWAKVFPIRLMLRLGAEYRYYPCPLISVRFRKPVFSEIGHTIMNLLADFRNYQYMLPQVPGVSVHMEDKHTTINFPRNRYNNIMKMLANSNDHVMAMGSNFSMKADSHLVCIQSEEGSYQTQAINIQNKPRQITGASFVVFNGAFKPSGGTRAKSSIVEDGLMVQITAETMAELKEAMRNMTDYKIECGNVDGAQTEESVTVQWVEDDLGTNVGVKSPIDNMPMDGTTSIRIHTSTDFVGDKHTVRWTEVFFIDNQTDSNSRSEPVDLSRLAESLANATCVALTPLLDKLQEAHLTKIGLRATIDPDQVCYEVGSNGAKLPDQHMDMLDSALIPVIHNAATQNQDGPVVLELIFHIIE